MSRRVVNIGFAFGAVILFGIVATRVVALGGGDSAVAPPVVAATVDAPTPMVPTPAASPARAPVDRALRSYAVKVVELQGLPPDAAPGTVFDVWVAWEPPLTKRPQFELLVPKVTLDKIVPPVTPDGPATAVLLVRTADLTDLLYADRFGAMSVAVVPPPEPPAQP